MSEQILPIDGVADVEVPATPEAPDELATLDLDAIFARDAAISVSESQIEARVEEMAQFETIVRNTTNEQFTRAAGVVGTLMSSLGNLAGACAAGLCLHPHGSMGAVSGAGGHAHDLGGFFGGHGHAHGEHGHNHSGGSSFFGIPTRSSGGYSGDWSAMDFPTLQQIFGPWAESLIAISPFGVFENLLGILFPVAQTTYGTT